MKHFLFFLIIFFLGVSFTPSQGDVGQDLVKFFNAVGTSFNATNPGAYKDQSAGYYTGGSFFARNTVHQANLASLRLPNYRAGCGGIDLYMGSLSFISSEELVRAFRAVASNIASYGLLLAIETMSPQIKNIMTELNDLAQKINQSNINSCEIAATTLGAILPKSDAANRHLCTMIGTNSPYGEFSDYASAKQGCGPGGRRDEIVERGKEDPRFQKMLGTEFNLAWKAIQENAFLRSDPLLSEFFMTLSGTIISRREGEEYALLTKPSLVDQETLLNVLLKGGSLRVYKCNDVESNKCLEVGEQEVRIDSPQAFETRIRHILISIQNKIYEDKVLSIREKAFLNSTRLPFYKILNVSTAFRKGEAPLDMGDYSELAAIDVLFQYLGEILDLINESAAHLKSAQVDSTQIEKFQKHLLLARSRVHEKRMSTFKQVEQIFAVLKKTEMLEKMLASKLGVLAVEGI